MPHLSASPRAPRTRLRSTLAAVVLLPLLAAAVASCGGGGDGPSGPSTGSLRLAVTGLPAGTTAQIAVTGPGQFSRQVAGGETLDGLAPGSYAFTAADVTTDAEIWAAREPKGTVAVVAGSTPAVAAVEYVPASGSLTVTVQGLPDGTSADVTVTSIDGVFTRKLTGSTTLTRLRAGSYVVSVGTVSIGSTMYFVAGAPQAQTVTVAAGGTATATVPYGEVTGLNLAVAGLYVVQTVQRLDQSIPLVQGRDGLLRVFVRAARDETPAPAVRVRFYVNGQLSSEKTIAPPMKYAPTIGADVAQGSLSSSWNVAIPASLVQPGLSISAEVDPGNAIAEIDETDNVYPAVGQHQAANVRSVPGLRVRFVPIYQSVNGLVGDVSAANQERFLAVTRKIHPLATIDADIRSPYTTSLPQVSSTNSDTSWTRVLQEIDVARDIDPDGASRYYYGVIKVTYGSGTAGLGYIGYPVAMGWDYLPSASEIMAHELGHNWGRYHAPCGVENADSRYPYAGGKIGVYGYDATTGQIRFPSAPDLMGYCNGTWISDYTYNGVMNFRAAAGASVGSSSDGASAGAGGTEATESAAQGPVQRCMLVWGRIVNGQPALEPAFEVMARPSLPRGGGPLTLAATSAGGATLWSLAFSGREIADAPRGDRTFAFTIPIAQAHVDEIAALRLVGPGGAATSSVAAGARGAAPEVRVARTTRPRWVRVRWDATRHPVAMVRDPATGAILSFARGGDANVRTTSDAATAVDVVLSDRVRSVSRRVTVAPQ